ncbi:AAA-ATPase [Phocaeicola salanitronis DSM 18170]|uniref:AAA-ATPase n=1 Tax=Phocaeicola salanitronis (strain DSM 18170 / JCM 13657 / CCUG 60908 / BL78) TaxID=667015 RepID=F0R2G8_PHOSB|nr:ATP-binding protein [Phocaeicola salanitronis]ADY37506.1 AAA-ATPase [Phocaeicola salanitronis DSM 18170]
MKPLEPRKYPVGIQVFSMIRNENYLYVDKTEYVYRMTHANSKYMFLSRPRRFGKSLLTDTLQCYFEGRKELFEGLAIEKLETEWTEYPVLHFDMSMGKHLDEKALIRYLQSILQDNEIRQGTQARETEDVNVRLKDLIMDTYAKYNKEVVVLIDEYDAPLLDVMHEEEELPKLRNVMRNFYSPLKACGKYLRYVFLTGITKFSQLSIFSELNNIQNISMLPEYAAVCGITEEEMRTQMNIDMELLADKLGTGKEEAMERLKENYDGYHFAWPSPDIYNPYSLLGALNEGRLASYWFGSGTPTYLIEMLNKYQIIPQAIGGRQCEASDFDAPTERMTDITPLLYQSGYLTIKDYSPFSELYLLDIPNKEVRIGLMKSLLANYVKRPAELRTLVGQMAERIHFDDMDGALRLMQTVLSTVPYCENTRYEGHYQQMLYLIFTLLGNFSDVEVRTPTGRVDVVMRTHSTLYIIELKLDKSAAEALRQIDLKQYPERFALCGLPIVKVGINFDTERHTLESWEIRTGQG